MSVATLIEELISNGNIRHAFYTPRVGAPRTLDFFLSDTAASALQEMGIASAKVRNAKLEPAGVFFDLGEHMHKLTDPQSLSYAIAKEGKNPSEILQRVESLPPSEMQLMFARVNDTRAAQMQRNREQLGTALDRLNSYNAGMVEERAAINEALDALTGIRKKG